MVPPRPTTLFEESEAQLNSSSPEDRSGSQRSSVRFPDSWASVHFDLLRGLAAFFVLFSHWRNLLFIDYHQVTGDHLLSAGFYILSAAGHQSVIVFFVLSGYFIGGTVFRSLERNQWAWSSYLLRRIVRLWTVLIPALFLCLFWDRLGIHLRIAPDLYAGWGHSVMIQFDVSKVLSPRIFLGNLFFLQTIVSPIFGSDGALWSLANEFWYYILFPLALITFWPAQRKLNRFLCAALFVLAARFIGANMLMDFPIWLAGVVLFKLPPPPLAPASAKVLRIAASFLYAPVFFGILHLPGVGGLNADYLLTVVTMIYFWILLSAKDRYDFRARSVRVSRELARFSYSLYALHVPFLLFLAALTVRDSRWSPTPLHILAGLGILIAGLVYAYVIAFFTEFRTDAIRQRLAPLLGIADAPPILPSNPLP
jgi:peptidoglycan/LPS O-acetylase OafA/YrhL